MNSDKMNMNPSDIFETNPVDFHGILVTIKWRYHYATAFKGESLFIRASSRIFVSSKNNSNVGNSTLELFICETNTSPNIVRREWGVSPLLREALRLGMGHIPMEYKLSGTHQITANGGHSSIKAQMENRVKALLVAAEEHLQMLLQPGRDFFPGATEEDLLSPPIIGEDGVSI